MQCAPEQKVDIYAKAIEGLLTLEPNIEKQIKYLDFVDIYTGLSDTERQLYEPSARGLTQGGAGHQGLTQEATFSSALCISVDPANEENNS